MTGRIGIDDIEPVVSCGQYPSKAVVGEVVPVSATVWREGHDAVAATVVLTGPDGTSRPVRMSPAAEPDRFHALVRPDLTGYWSLRIEGWSDPISTWRSAVEKKLAAGQGPAELANDLELGARLLDRAAGGVPELARPAVAAAAAALRDTDRSLVERTGAALHPEIARVLDEHPVRDLVTKSRTVRIWVDRTRALFGSWYELFPRSTGGWDGNGVPVHGTFHTAAEDLPRIADMGFDIVYLPPIHPIGTVNRKGRNNTLTPQAHDVGSPWAIGAASGGHDAVHPALGTLDDFDYFAQRARDLGMEVALDLAFQAAPDHPWAAEHPEWFTVLPDGTIAYAENPPKKYQDIYPINFDDDRVGIYRELLRVTLFWVRRGVQVFRVDNPHTKPPDFWFWLINEVKKVDRDVLFLAEAFTRPARMYGLAQAGFTQSYTYFTWRTAKWELEEFAREHAAKADVCRPNLWVNTPDILHESLQHGGPGMFAIRATLASTLSPSWGMYSGFELFEHQAVRPGSEEYSDSEKYELRPRDYKAAQSRGESLEPWITRLNEIRRRHPALQQLRNLHFHHVDNDALIAYSKHDAVTGDLVLIVVNLNPFGAESGVVWLDLPALGLDWHERFTVRDEVSGEVYQWGQANFVRLEPWRNVAHILALPQLSPQARENLSYREA
ncbi:Alpha-1,4-glucan:maltose-1-phosphate maltosyltransferase OS=Tsukamurella paurometabola (strain ATCC 8368 / DSM / CCUG 35730 / CIP 100753 / JCM 10117 / KCTC 9821 / NBRC 16120 / NCIMB 702349 / NCTC 13040) OX=521096 GN=glgE PE=3 SV=1 [Tsukamurella paurometabola]|uniref:Alpha-1,4-glucan:maltose-1-phosphate maltosyltransferase n=1 Tax=Tsukamurella paurometabola (strain ATCC 8368 / DSM 20162 / CCUG 35730 / CIP 100753 / JCM 10117 / KCTC 9821 / NBRC 16120 / NCIMB 702349 / NCTC 13040) TaxID=521096 RepID=D5UWN7_TSUPD|nr:alpha-1,4-glucan--maltose-1-phosphate maltosyltransferase [Tsukamurella paurometabola]ADG77909.1 alpha amylase catalytic region [Tsukamurella paurometabola DSM 20162]SUP29313.1 Alpha-1,4-glucan:maltose-1-phosphate maltosyltransferase [Tsukamurella paurometabola]